jgi:hypothetical protein
MIKLSIGDLALALYMCNKILLFKKFKKREKSFSGRRRGYPKFYSVKQ